ncbi:hypothetical protein U1Q18_035215 [Sarracenia purpurea var. burkii]
MPTNLRVCGRLVPTAMAAKWIHSKRILNFHTIWDHFQLQLLPARLENHLCGIHNRDRGVAPILQRFLGPPGRRRFLAIDSPDRQILSQLDLAATTEGTLLGCVASRCRRIHSRPRQGCPAL